MSDMWDRRPKWEQRRETRNILSVILVAVLGVAALMATCAIGCKP